jgi:glycerophosphoryl diester phosphodiesterase
VGATAAVTLVLGHDPDVVRAIGADGIELDVRRTVDDHLVVIHDADLPSGIAIAEAMRHDIPWSVPDLADVLDACTGLTVNIEIKNFPRDPAWDPAQRVTRLVLDLLDRRDRRDDVLVSCFDFGAIDLARARGIPAAMLYLSRRPAVDLLDAVVALGHDTVHPYESMVDEQLISAARERGLTVHVWGESRFDELADLGVDGFITEDVEAALRSVRRRG